MKLHDPKIVADGEYRLWKAKDYWAVRRRVTNEVKEQHTVQLEGATVIRWLVVWLTIRREIRARMRKEFPSGALYLSRHIAVEAPISVARSDAVSRDNNCR